MTNMNGLNLNKVTSPLTKTQPLNKTLESMPDILTARDIAEYLHISRRRVYELFQLHPSQGGITNFDIGNSKRVDKDDFIAWVKALKLQKQTKKSA